VRLAKARKGIETIGDTHVQMDNLGVMEISEIRFLSHAMDQLRQLTEEKADGEDNIDTVTDRSGTVQGSMADDDY